MYTEKDKLTQSNITDVMERAYIDYSMSVIISRALPDARDGLKPVQRRILYSMMRQGLVHNRKHDKCAAVVGEVLGKYHPHGDASVYDTLVRMAQNWVMRVPLVDPQGNFGSVDGDPPAAYRYTECRLTSAAEELIRQIDEDTVDFVPNYKEDTTEPSVMPAALPSLLMNGSTGIAVGMTTNIPPHNLGELIDGACKIIDNPNVDIEEMAGRTKRREVVRARELLTTLAVERYGLRVTDISTALNVRYDSASLWGRRGANRRVSDQGFLNRLDEIDAILATSPPSKPSDLQKQE